MTDQFNQSNASSYLPSIYEGVSGNQIMPPAGALADPYAARRGSRHLDVNMDAAIRIASLPLMPEAKNLSTNESIGTNQRESKREPSEHGLSQPE